MDAPRVARVLVVANRTAATPWLLEEVERRARAGPCEIALLVPPLPARRADWSLDAAVALLGRAAGTRVRGLTGGPDPVAAVRDALREHAYDEILVSTPPTRGPKWLRRDLIRRLDGLGVPVTAVIPGRRPSLDQTVLRVRWDDERP